MCIFHFLKMHIIDLIMNNSYVHFLLFKNAYYWSYCEQIMCDHGAQNQS